MKRFFNSESGNVVCTENPTTIALMEGSPAYEELPDEEPAIVVPAAPKKATKKK
jgi:hypothetical protein